MFPGIDEFEGATDPEVIALVKDILQREAIAEAVATEARMAEIGAFNRGDCYAVPGIGETRYRFDAGHFFMTAALHGVNPSDPEFKPWLAKREQGEYARVKSKGTKITSGFTGASDFEYRAPKFHKSYA